MLDILDKYDHQQLTIERITPESIFIIDYKEAMKAIYDLKNKFGGVLYSETKKTNHLKVQSEQSTKHSAAMMYIRA